MPELRLVSQLLHDWYHKTQRVLPWRNFDSGYQIWVSEIMLQQTTVKAVIPYFENFLSKFPDLKSLALSPLDEVLEAWSGLGYYSRARNIHKSAQLFYKNRGMPQSHAELLNYPGIGPYTSRAISSIAFGERIGVLDGNVIRVLSRVHGLKTEWWKTAARNQLQSLADQLCQFDPPSADINQAMMDLGATVCTSQNPQCQKCPVRQVCVSHQHQVMDEIPLQRKKTQSQDWLWSPSIIEREGKILLIKNNGMPFLKGRWVFPGNIEKLDARPSAYDFKHHITHYNIYVKLRNGSVHHSPSEEFWCVKSDLKKYNPSSLLTKCLK